MDSVATSARENYSLNSRTSSIKKMKWFGIAVNTNWDEKFIIYLIIYIYLEVIKKLIEIYLYE